MTLWGLPTYAAGDSYPTLQQIPDAGQLQEWVVAVLNQQMRGETAFANEARADGTAAMRYFSEVVPAPEILTDDFINKIVVGMAVNTERIAHRRIENRGSLTVALVGEPNLSPTAILPFWQTANVVLAILEPYSAGWPLTGTGEKKFFDLLMPRTVEMLPPTVQFNGYSGVLVTFEFWQAASGRKYRPDAA